MDKLASTQYDYICCIDAESGKVFFYTSPDGSLRRKEAQERLQFRAGDDGVQRSFRHLFRPGILCEFMKLKNVMHIC